MVAYSRVPEPDELRPKRGRVGLGLALGVVGAVATFASLGRPFSSHHREEALFSAPAAAEGSEDDDLGGGLVTMATPSLDGAPVNVVLSAPTRSSIVVSCWCDAPADVTVEYWRRGHSRAVATTAPVACGTPEALTLSLAELHPGTRYAYRVLLSTGEATDAHGFETAGAGAITFTVSADAHFYADAANREVFEEMAAKVAAKPGSFHVQLGCSWMLDQYSAWETKKETVAAFVRGTRHWFQTLSADVALFGVQGPHSGENWQDFYECRTGEGLSPDSLTNRAKWSVDARLTRVRGAGLSLPST